MYEDEFDDEFPIEEFDALDFATWDADGMHEEFTTESAIPETSEWYLGGTTDERLRDQLGRSNAHWMQIPIPADIVPVGGSPLAAMDDETLLNTNVGLLIHIAQTAANGGVQVIGPQQMPLATLMGHTAEAQRTADMHITGSVASRNMEWPIIRGPSDPCLFPDVPIDGGPGAVSIRPKTKTHTLVPPSDEMRDPIVAAFVRARGMIDLQNRSDIGGDGAAVGEVVANAWGVPANTFLNMEDVSLAPSGSLLRYAARADQVMPRIYAAFNDLLCLSTGAGSVGRLVYGKHSAIDWRRCRVLAESIFLNSSRLEGYSLMRMSSDVRPGDPRANPMRAGVLQMRPMPGSVWSFAPETFRLSSCLPALREEETVMPPRVTAALNRYDATVNPLYIARSVGLHVTYSPTIVREIAPTTAESLIKGYASTMFGHLTKQVRGKTAAASVRDALYASISSAVDINHIRLFETASCIRSCAEDVNMLTRIGVPTYSALGASMKGFCTSIRAALSVEADLRRSSLDTWWNDFKSVLPRDMKEMPESSIAWATGAIWCLLNPPTEKWKKLSSAVSHSQLKGMSEQAVVCARLPVVRRSIARINAAAHARMASVASVFSVKYAARASAAYQISELARLIGKLSVCRRLRTAGAMWNIRAELTRTAHLREALDETEGLIHVMDKTYVISCSAHTAYKSFRDNLRACKDVTKSVKDHFPNHVTGRISDLFESSPKIIFSDCDRWSSKSMRYASDPRQLAEDMNRTIHDMTADIRETVSKYATEEPDSLGPAVDIGFENGEDIAGIIRDMMRSRDKTDGEIDYYEAISGADGMGEEIDNYLMDLDEEVQESIRDRMWSSSGAVLAWYQNERGTEKKARDAAKDVIQ